MSQYSPKAMLYFPTTILLIDDDPIFLSLLSLQISSRIPILLKDKPKEALELLLDRPQVNALIHKLISDYDPGDCTYNFYKMIYNEQRFSCISTVIIDYSMPQLNGEELCEQIAHLPITKIMLTAEADHQKAVQLFNDKLIDYFIIKGSSDMDAELNKVIHKAQLSYFEQASLLKDDKTAEPYKKQENNIAVLLKDKIFSEYYLLDSSGSILLLDYDGKPDWLALKSFEDIENYYDIANNQETSETVLRLLKNKAIPFFFNPKDFKVPAAEWEPYLHIGRQLLGSSNYQYAFIKENSPYQLEKNRIFSHKNYLKKVEVLTSNPVELIK